MFCWRDWVRISLAGEKKSRNCEGFQIFLRKLSFWPSFWGIVYHLNLDPIIWAGSISTYRVRCCIWVKKTDFCHSDSQKIVRALICLSQTNGSELNLREYDVFCGFLENIGDQSGFPVHKYSVFYLFAFWAFFDSSFTFRSESPFWRNCRWLIYTYTFILALRNGVISPVISRYRAKMQNMPWIGTSEGGAIIP